MFKIKYTLKEVLRMMPPIIYDDGKELKLIIDMAREVIGYTNADTEDFYHALYFNGGDNSNRSLAEAGAQLLYFLLKEKLITVEPNKQKN